MRPLPETITPGPDRVYVRRLALFAGDTWSTAGWSHKHYRGTFDTVEEAVAALPEPHEVTDSWGSGYARVLDLATGELVATRRSTYGPPGESEWIDGDGAVG